MDFEEQSAHLRVALTTDQRNAPMRLSIDPGFVHHRKIQTLLGPDGMNIVDEAIRDLPEMPDWVRSGRISHIYKDALLIFCRVNEAPTLGQALAAHQGTVFCSTEELLATPEVYHSRRVVSRVVTLGVDAPAVELNYSTANIVADTLRSQLADGATVSVVAQFDSYRDNKVIFHPLLMGSPWLSSQTQPRPFPGPEWYSHAFFENFIEDIEEFAKVRDVKAPADFAIMQQVSESAFKQCLAEILGDTPKADWGGEVSDHYTAHVHLGRKRTTAAFLLKGPARFAPMGLNHLGKNNDQIYRLSQEPAELLIVQHCHNILSPVRATLRVFAVQPGNVRRYCLIDGRDSLRLLMAYGKLDQAIRMSK